jgi:uncharacterized membrane protein YdbT with pleckstrin-like domain
MSTTYLESLLSEREKVLHATRHHWFILARSILLEITTIILIFAITITVSLFMGPTPAAPFISLVVLLGVLILIFPIVTGTRDILIWTNHQFIITNRRVMQINGVINKNVIDSSLEKVNDVKMEQSFFGRIFGYGDIEILTASELGVNKFQKIDDPIRFKTAMLNAKAALENGQAVVVEKAPNIPSMIAQLAELRRQEVITEEEFQAKKSALLAKL